MTEVRWGIIGCGDVTEVKSGPAFSAVEASRLVAVMRRDAAKAADYARRHAVPRWYDDAQKLIGDPEVNAVYIATPPGAHKDYALAVAAAGKHCYVEKPMARSAAECREMIAAFDQAGTKLFVAYYRRALPAFVKARTLIREGAIGRVTSVSHRHSMPAHRQSRQQLGWRVEAEHAGAGLFLDLASHLLDALDFIVGPLQDVAGTAANVASDYDVDDVAAVSFRTPSGSAGVSLWNFASDQPEDRIEITGTDGRISWGCFGDGTVTLQQGSQTQVFACPPPAHVQEPLIRMVIQDLLGRGQCPSTGRTALRTSEAMDRVLQSYYGRRDDAFWTRPQTWRRGR